MAGLSFGLVQSNVAKFALARRTDVISAAVVFNVQTSLPTSLGMLIRRGHGGVGGGGRGRTEFVFNAISLGTVMFRTACHRLSPDSLASCSIDLHAVVC